MEKNRQKFCTILNSISKKIKEGTCETRKKIVFHFKGSFCSQEKQSLEL